MKSFRSFQIAAASLAFVLAAVACSGPQTAPPANTNANALSNPAAKDTAYVLTVKGMM